MHLLTTAPSPHMLEPVEVVDIDLPEEYSGAVIDLLSTRKGSMLDMGSANADGMIGIQYEVPTRGMVGVKSRLMTATRGLAVMTATFGGYKPYAGDFPGRNRGNLLSHEQGTASAYALEKAQVRGTLFTKPNDEVYEDQIIGIHASTGDLKVNVCKMKQLTNFRTVLKDDATILHPPKVMTLEDGVHRRRRVCRDHARCDSLRYEQKAIEAPWPRMRDRPVKRQTCEETNL